MCVCVFVNLHYCIAGKFGDEMKVPVGKFKIFWLSCETRLFLKYRKFYLDLSEHEDSLEGVCNTILQHAPEFKCYVPFLCNMERGLQILSQYGGSFFHDKQREIGDEMSVTSHYCRLKERWKEYLNYFKELYVCAQKEYLHGVSLVKVSITLCYM